MVSNFIKAKLYTITYSTFILLLLVLSPYTANAQIEATQAPRLLLAVGSAQISEGDRVTVLIKVSSADQSINAISGTVYFPVNLLRIVSISKENSIVNFWTQDPKASSNNILFEGVILNPGFQGANGTLFQVTFEAKKAGTAALGFSNATILANDGLGTNLATTLSSTVLKILPGSSYFKNESIANNSVGSKNISTLNERKLTALPVIIDYNSSAEAKNGFYIKGKGEPSAITKIVFKSVATKSLGEQILGLLQTEKKNLNEVLLNNDPNGDFEYVSSRNLVAGVYNATPFLVDENTNTEKPGLGVQLLVTDSKIVKALVVLINVLGLLIPVVVLGVIIYFIPWYSFKRMRIIKKKLGLEEEKLSLTEHQLQRQDRAADTDINTLVNRGQS